MMRYLILAIYLLLMFFVACSVSEHSSPSMANQGILALSTSNPYLGTNLFLAGQAEKSNILFRFLEKRGGPTAIEIIDESFDRPRMLLYYPRDREVYAADLESRGKDLEWIIRGPFRVERKDYLTLQRMEHSMIGEPVFVLHGSETRFKQSDSLNQSHTVLAAKVPLPLPTAIPVKPVARKAPPPIIRSAEDVPKIEDFSKMNTDQKAILLSKGYAERADNGDVIHTVSGEGQTLTAVAKWYTGSAAALKEIASLNSLETEGTLSSGTRVRIPQKLVKNFKAMQGQ